MRFSRIVSALACAFVLNANAAPVEEYTQYLPDGANLALVVQKIGASAPTIDYHSQQMALPASTQKVLTALAALLQLGPDYRFTTTLESQGDIRDGVLRGNLIARFSGDPTFKRQSLRNMVAILKKQGVRQISGDVLVDTSVFASHDKAPGWPWNDLTQCFSAPPAAAIVDRNCFSVSLYSAPNPGDMAFIRVASYYPVNMFSQVRTLARGSADAQYCELDVVPGELNRFTLTGCLTQRSEPLPLAFAIQDGASYAGAILKDELTQAGIQIDGHLKRQTRPGITGTVIAQTQSAPLHDLLKIMLKKSDNMIADTVFRTIGHERFGVPGTWRAGSDAVRQVLRQKAGIDLGNTIIADGSGLSRHNLLAPATMMQALQYIAQHDNELNFISMLPLSGYDGTLRYRGGLHEAGVDGKVSAKTGALQGVYNLAGFITTASGQRMAFVQYLSGYAVPPEDQKQRRAPLLLVVEDDELLQQGLALALTGEGYVCDCAATAAEANSLLITSQYSMVILDLGLPDMDGAALLRQWRRQQIDLPVLILTARDALEDRVDGLDAGADDYLVKPFALVELQARVRALLRRYQGHSDNLMQVDDLQLNLSSQQVYLQQQPVEVTPKEFAILARLIMRAGQTVNRELLQQDLYTWQDDLGSNTLEVHIHNLRRKLGKDRIRTVRGIGYRLEPSS
ncbi:hypothetical protein KR044_013096 [Drosophila immigrans]|nr:hypothetical protein KR044_013096 [Drosophila immigrans]